MKLRFTPSSVRIRLNQSEVAKFMNSGQLSERVEFPGPTATAFVYSLRFAGELETGSAHIINGELQVMVPQGQAKSWANDAKEVGLYYTQGSQGGQTLRIAIEKDFQCVDGPPEDRDPAAYPNPVAKEGCRTGSK